MPLVSFQIILIYFLSFFFRVNLELLQKAGITIYWTVQRPGDLIVTSSFHQVKNKYLQLFSLLFIFREFHWEQIWLFLSTGPKMIQIF